MVLGVSVGCVCGRSGREAEAWSPGSKGLSRAGRLWEGGTLHLNMAEGLRSMSEPAHPVALAGCWGWVVCGEPHLRGGAPAGEVHKAALSPLLTDTRSLALGKCLCPGKLHPGLPHLSLCWDSQLVPGLLPTTCTMQLPER